MIEEKKDAECVHIGPIKICEGHKKMILNKQKQVKEQQGRRIGKAVAIKLLLDDLLECMQSR